MTFIKIITIAVSLISALRLIPKCKVVPSADIVVLEDELNQINKINKKQKEDIANLRRDYKDMEKSYQSVFLLEQEGQILIKKQAAQITQQLEQITTYKKDNEIANDEFNALQDQVIEATELSNQLKEALTKWTS